MKKNLMMPIHFVQSPPKALDLQAHQVAKRSAMTSSGGTVTHDPILQTQEGSAEDVGTEVIHLQWQGFQQISPGVAEFLR